jgi:pilus assembly protein CpaF
MFQVTVETNKGTRVADIFCSDETCVIGKGPENLVSLHGWNVDRHHAELCLKADGVHVRDLSRRSGIRVNGQKLQAYGPLTERDVIAIHDYRIRAACKRGPLASGERDGRVLPESDPGRQPVADGRAEATMAGPARDPFRKYRAEVREALLAQLDLRRLNVNDMSDDELRRVTGAIVQEIIAGMAEDLPSSIDPDALHGQVIAEAVGLGPLEGLVARDDISEIMVNSAQEIFYEKAGRLFRSEVTFTDDKAVEAAIERIVTPLGRRIDEGSPMVDARLKDGSRVNAVIPPLALKGPCLTIRKFMKERLSDENLVAFGSASQDMMGFLKMAVRHRRNVVISGGTGSGKTTLLNVLSNFIPDDERIVTVEDAAELRLYQPNLVSLEARPPNQEGRGAVTIRDLVRNCLRMRPDRIVVGECRGGEALDMLQAMNTGHDGSLTTAHANSPRDCISRLEVMVMMAGMDLPVLAIREQLASAVHLIVQQSRFSCGSRKITSICELAGIESGKIQLSEIFRYRQTGHDAQGRTLGHYEATQIVPDFYQKLYHGGVDVDLRIFQRTVDGQTVEAAT